MYSSVEIDRETAGNSNRNTKLYKHALPSQLICGYRVCGGVGGIGVRLALGRLVNELPLCNLSQCFVPAAGVRVGTSRMRIIDQRFSGCQTETYMGRLPHIGWVRPETSRGTMKETVASNEATSRRDRMATHDTSMLRTLTTQRQASRQMSAPLEAKP